jgi:hypothetical protein
MDEFAIGDVIRSDKGLIAIVTSVSFVIHRYYCLGSDGRTFTIDQGYTSKWTIVDDMHDKLTEFINELKAKGE